tara:strand:+ start:1982 stop:2224 length:243 start_codon:yes stop_codon:yes gene_type:complete
MKTDQIQISASVNNTPLNINEASINTLDKFKGKPWRNYFEKIVHNWKTRQVLRTLNESQMKDIGLTSASIDNEINKPWWK